MKLPWDRLERLLIILIALHSFGMGIGLIWAPPWGLEFAGWRETGPLFFPHQGGVFHLVLGVAYLIEYYRYRGIIILVMAKASATVFLLLSTALGEAAWVVPFSGVMDALMGIAVLIVHREVMKLEKAVQE